MKRKRDFPSSLICSLKLSSKGRGGGVGNRANLLTSDHSAPFQSVKL